MTVHIRSGALALLVLAFAIPQAAHAEDTSKCKFAEIAKLPVLMEGDRATISVSVNGRDTRLWLDSGAFFNIMPKSKAAEFGLTTEPMPIGFILKGIGGSSTAEYTRIRDFRIGSAQLHNMGFVVGGSDPGNGFLGANLLGVFDTEFDLAKSQVNLFEEHGCSRVNLAYWAQGMSVFEARLLPGANEHDHHIFVEVIVNGHTLRAMLDSGAPISTINRHAAERAGIDLNTPQVTASMKIGGFGSHQRQSWIVRTATISIGGEQIHNSPIRVIDDHGDGLDTDMLLGVDFLMAHHVMVSQTQRKLFLTYNGGAIFSVSTDGEIGHRETRSEVAGASEQAADPVTADDFARRGSARLTRNDVIGAIADLTDAIRLAPTRVDLLTDRANAYARGGHPELAAKDVEAGLALAPNDHRLLARRARMRLAKGDKAGALVDTDAAAAATPKGSLDIVAVAIMYDRLGKADRGLALLDPVIETHRDDSGYPMLLNARSWNRGLANADLDRALRDINTALRKTDNNPTMLDTRALIQLRRKDFASAIADASAVLDKMPNLATSLYFRGLARIGSGDSVQGNADIAAARAQQADIDQRFEAYDLAAPKTAGSAPAQPLRPGGDQSADQ